MLNSEKFSIFQQNRGLDKTQILRTLWQRFSLVLRSGWIAGDLVTLCYIRLVLYI